MGVSVRNKYNSNGQCQQKLLLEIRTLEPNEIFKFMSSKHRTP